MFVRVTSVVPTSRARENYFKPTSVPSPLYPQKPKLQAAGFGKP